VPYWKPLIIDGQRYDLSHLKPFEFAVTPKGWNETTRMSVRFHDHCFTEKYDPNHHMSKLISSQQSKHEERAFDQLRYQMSFQLPELIRGLENKRISSTRNGNLVRVELADGQEYGVFFTLKKEAHNRCILYVVSAYPLSRPRQKIIVTGEMKFNVAVGLVLKGKRPKFPVKPR
jgi:hypothetical protein